MKLRNKKTGEIIEAKSCNNIGGCISIYYEENDGQIGTKDCYASLAELNKEWEDYEEPKDHWHIGCEGDVFIDNTERYLKSYSLIGNDFETKEEAEQAVEKLKAWKRLKDKGFKFYAYTALGCGEIHFMLDWEDIDEKQLRQDLDLLFGGKE